MGVGSATGRGISQNFNFGHPGGIKFCLSKGGGGKGGGYETKLENFLDSRQKAAKLLAFF